MIENPKVSILIPVYNTERYIYGSIKSALSQKYENKEIIVIDDGSTDETDMICKSFGNKIKYMKNDKNMGIGFTRQRLVEESTGDLIVFISADDILSDVFITEMLKEVEDNKILYSSYLVIDQDGNVLRQNDAISFKNHIDFKIASYEMAERFSMLVNISCVMIPKIVFKEVKFNKDLRLCEDLDFVLKSMMKFEYKAVNKVLVKYRISATMTTSKKWNEIEKIDSDIFKNFDKLVNR